jgi:hypothetical protein
MMSADRRARSPRLVPLARWTVAVAMLVAFSIGAAPLLSRGSAHADSAPVTLEGAGTTDVTAELATWGSQLNTDTASAVTGTLGGYLADGDNAGRQLFLGGNADYVISGVPFLPSEVSQLPAGGVIAAPIMPSAAGVMLAAPADGFEVYDTDTGNFSDYGPTQATTPTQAVSCLAGVSEPNCPPVNVPSPQLVEMLGAGTQGWNDPAIYDTWNQTDLGYTDPTVDVLAGAFQSPSGGSNPIAITRSDPNDENYYLGEWEAAQAPSEYPSDSPSESWPAGVGGQNQVIGLSSVVDSISPDSYGDGYTGSLYEVPPSIGSLDLAQDNLDQATYEKNNVPTYLQLYAADEWIGVQNANGDWTVPTASAVDAGIDAGAAQGASACGSTNQNALYAMNNDVPGAYPVSWVDCLYAPATGLSLAKTDAMAGYIRYLVTDGQSTLTADGDGVLPTSYVLQALAAANEVVTSNCPGAGGQVVETTSNTYEPTSPGVVSLGAVDECVAASATTSTTVATGSTTPTTATSTSTTSTTLPASADVGVSSSTGGSAFPSSFSATGFGSSSSSEALGTTAGSSGTTSPTSVASTATSTSGSTGSVDHSTLIAAETATNLPDSVGGTSGQGIDKLAALLLGAAAFLVGRRSFRWLGRVLRS